MRETMTLLSVNTGDEVSLEHRGKTFTSGIFKRPVEGGIAVSEAGIAGDAVVDAAHHGGPDQAVYAYSADDYDWWHATHGRRFSPGAFGENLTIRGLPSDPNVGDRLLIGEVVLEVTAPRIPCDTLAAAVDDRSIGRLFRDAERPGVYCRVLNEGMLAAGDSVTLVEHDGAETSIVELFRWCYAPRGDDRVDALQRLLRAPLAERFRERVSERLAQLQQT